MRLKVFANNIQNISRITLTKSLALAKFIHLLLALPKPPDYLLETIERIFYIVRGMEAQIELNQVSSLKI